ncbi:hypothetical protein JCM11251_005227 [Rhodosporidiobolus azoricus]
MAVVAPSAPRPPHQTIHPDHMSTAQLDKLAAQLQAERKGGKKLPPSLDALSGAKAPSVKELLANPVVFVKPKNRVEEEEIPYKPVNVKSAPSKPNGISQTTASSPIASTSKLPAASTSSSSSAQDSSSSSSKRVFPLIDSSVSWSKNYPVGAGLHNLGNTCFLNSALQCLLHVPPLVRYLEGGGHPGPKECPMYQKKQFCMTCVMRHLVKNSFTGGKKAYAPQMVTKNLKAIAKHFRLGRQEDSHEFLRFCIDAMQASALFGKGKLPPAQQHQSPLHQIFGGRLRSRVHCESCGHNSDTYDNMLDLSLDINGRTETLKDALGNLVKVDRLTGGNKYKCEKCKKLVNASKSFTIEDAPLVLTIHLKRFTPMGRKIGNVVKYPEVLKLGNYMSNSSHDPTYRLSSLILHSGGGPHSGHYTAYVRSSSGKWYDMNDDYVSPVHGGGPPLGERNAYVLFYVREKGDALKGAIAQGGGAVAKGGPVGKKRSRESLSSQNGNGGGGTGTPIKRVKPDHLSNAANAAPASSSPPATNIRVPFVGPGPPEVLTASKVASPRLTTTNNDLPPASPSGPPSPKAVNPFLPPASAAVQQSPKQFISRADSLSNGTAAGGGGGGEEGAGAAMGLGKKKKKNKNGTGGIVGAMGKKGEKRSAASSSHSGEASQSDGLSKSQRKKLARADKNRRMGLVLPEGMGRGKGKGMGRKNVPGVLR